jgi:hypothetical protein
LLRIALFYYMSSSARHTLRLSFDELIFVLVAHQSMEAVPQSGDCLVLSGHPEHLLKLPVELVAARKQFLETLYAI